ncbi:hypothetical protein [Breoghania sp.]|uniref:hypothetical protein n=1 Tax=Breoghania sp. TaxID=2065378 RepID=UPI002AA8F948|nr:hypothetical protein [Breoghania sp.]
MLVVYMKNGAPRSTYLRPMRCEISPEKVAGDGAIVPAVFETLDGQELMRWLLDRGRMPFGADALHRMLDEESIPHGWPLDSWGGAFVADGTLPVGDYVPTPTKADYTAAIQAMIDETARSRNYTDGMSIVTYVNSSVATWAAEAAIFVAWRDGVWSYAYEQLALVQEGTRAQPTVDELLAEIVPIDWGD